MKFPDSLAVIIFHTTNPDTFAFQ